MGSAVSHPGRAPLAGSSSEGSFHGTSTDDRPLRIAQVGDVAQVGQRLAAALSGQAQVTFLPMRQVGAGWPPALKPTALLPRYLEARRVHGLLRALQPPPDALHIHWVPNGLVGRLQGDSQRIPWILHVHGDDVRNLSGWRAPAYRRLLEQANAVVFSTPDLADDVLRWRPDAEHLPVPLSLDPIVVPIAWDVLAASAALEVKGAATTFAALRLIAATRPTARLAAMGGQAVEPGPWEVLERVPHDAWIRRLASSSVLIGQMKLGALGIVELEAMALGKAVVGWARPSLYPEDPPLVSASNPRAIAQVVASLLDDPAHRHEVGKAAQAWVRRHHDSGMVAKRLMGIYRRVIAAAARQ